MNSNPAAIVLAAGLSSRMGRSKPLLPFAGRTVLEHILAVLKDCPVDEILVVTGHECLTIEKLLSDRTRSVFNPDYSAGEMLSSIQVGLKSITPRIDSVLLVLGDQPLVESSVVEKIVAAYREGRGTIIFPSCQMRRGHPVLIARKYWRAILALNHQQTLREFFRGVESSEIFHVNVETPSVLSDMNMPADYERVLAEYASRVKTD